MHSCARPFSRRRFLGGLTLAGTAGLFGVYPRPVAAEPPPETTTLRLALSPAVCFAPQFVAKELLRSEGFTDVQYVRAEAGPYRFEVYFSARGGAEAQKGEHPFYVLPHEE